MTRVDELRREAEMTQEDLALASGVKYTTIRVILRTGTGRVENLQPIAVALSKQLHRRIRIEDLLPEGGAA